jgi:hypothetical protein
MSKRKRGADKIKRPEANDGETKETEANDGGTKQGKNKSSTAANKREIRLQAALERSKKKLQAALKRSQEKLQAAPEQKNKQRRQERSDEQFNEIREAVLRRHELEKQYKDLIERFKGLRIQLYTESQLRF